MPRAPKFTPVAATALVPAPANLFAGTSGWAYSAWKPGFYPADVPPRAFLHYYASRMTSVEVNYTFRELPTAEQLAGWLAATPPGFRFSFKAPQRITHFQRMLDCKDSTTEFFKAIKPAQKAGKLGLVLFQLPPNFKADASRLAKFLMHSRLRKGDVPLAFEFRHESWFNEEIYTVLRERNAALCVAETDELITPDIQTATHRCYRLRRSGGYKRKELKEFAAKFRHITSSGDVYAYFRHEEEPTGAWNAAETLRLAARLPVCPGVAA